MPKIGSTPPRSALKPFWSTTDGETVKLYQGHTTDVLRRLAEKSVHCVVTSPPYWGLRDYGTAEWEGGREDCDHIGKVRGGLWAGGSDKQRSNRGSGVTEGNCIKCGATRVDQQIGSEKTPEEFVTNLVAVFREVRRVLRDDGTVWLNLGDSYSGGTTGRNDSGNSIRRADGTEGEVTAKFKSSGGNGRAAIGLPSGNLLGMPWRVALALQADGWMLRQDIIWCLSGGTWLYVRGKKGEGLIQLHDLARDDEWAFGNLNTMELWNGERWTKILGISSSARKGDEIELVLRSGERISCTPNHKFPTKDKGLIEAGQLKVGDKLVRCRLPQPEKSRDSRHVGLDAAWFAGLYLAEGCGVDEGKISLAGHANETERWEKVQRIVASYGGSCTLKLKGNNQTISVHGKVICAVAKELVSGKNAHDKCFSQSVWKYSNDFIEQMMEGYLSGDGGKEPDQGGVRLGFCRNYNLERDLRAACSRLGWALTLKPQFTTLNGQKFPCFNGEIRRTRSGHHNEKDREEVMEIRKARCREVYDVGVADAPNLFTTATGILTHNSKPSPMPESVRNRCTKAHEYIFLFTKSARYFYDAEAIRTKTGKESTPEEYAAALAANGDEGNSDWYQRSSSKIKDGSKSGNPWHGITNPNGANKRSVWTVSSQGYEGAHFACFPPKLIEPCILAGTSEKGCCASCGAPWKRVVEEKALKRDRPNEYVKRSGEEGTGNSCPNGVAGVETRTVGWEPGCECGADVVPCTVLDPFIGSGTSCVVSLGRGRRSVGIDLSEKYLRDNAVPRIKGALLSRPGMAHLAGEIVKRIDWGTPEGES